MSDQIKRQQPVPSEVQRQQPTAPKDLTPSDMTPYDAPPRPEVQPQPAIDDRRTVDSTGLGE